MSEKMKPNDPHHWQISLSGLHGRRKLTIENTSFVGTYDEALAKADEMECEVDFDVTQAVLTRGLKAKKGGE